MPEIFDSAHAKQGGIKLSKDYKRYLIRKRISIALIGLLTIIVASLLIYVLSKRPINTDSGYVFTEIVEKYESGDTVLIASSDSFLDVIAHSVVKTEVLTGEVVAGPYGRIIPLTNGDYKIKDNVNEATVKLKSPSQMFLNDEYIIRVNGYSQYDIIVSDNMIVGKNPTITFTTEELPNFVE